MLSCGPRFIGENSAPALASPECCQLAQGKPSYLFFLVHETTRQNVATNYPTEAARYVFAACIIDHELADILLSELQLQYTNFKNGLQQIAQKIGDVEQEAEEHKFVMISLSTIIKHTAAASRPSLVSPVQAFNTPLECILTACVPTDSSLRPSSRSRETANVSE